MLATPAAVVSAPTAHASPAEGGIDRTDVATGTTEAPVVVTVGQPTTL
ncbi:hypothetical protein GR927_15610 [Mycolicibacterium sp. 3033]|nr:hypothetical protein [Mycolicibacterium aurantiacum]